MSTADESASSKGVVLTLPDGSIRKFDGAVSGAELAADIGPGLAKAAIAIVVDGEVRDLTRKIKNDSFFIIERESDNKMIEVNMFDIRSL